MRKQPLGWRPHSTLNAPPWEGDPVRLGLLRPKYSKELRRANNIRMQLGGKPGMLSPVPEKPNRMGPREAQSHALANFCASLASGAPRKTAGHRTSQTWHVDQG